MITAYDRSSMERLLTMSLDTRLHDLLVQRIGSLATTDGDLTEWTEYLIVERGDREADIVREIGFSPMVEPIDGLRYREPGFWPHWDWLSRHDGWHELVFTYGSAFAHVLFVEDHPDGDPDLLALCREFSA